MKVRLTLKDVLNGTEKKFKLKKYVTCEHCHGTGAVGVGQRKKEAVVGTFPFTVFVFYHRIVGTVLVPAVKRKFTDCVLTTRTDFKLNIINEE